MHGCMDAWMYGSQVHDFVHEVETLRFGRRSVGEHRSEKSIADFDHFVAPSLMQLSVAGLTIEGSVAVVNTTAWAHL